MLLTRDQFRNNVFERDGHKCVICGKPAADAHHIIERRLFPDGGYYLANGASLCPEHHLLAESTELSTDEIREAAGIDEIILPPHLYEDCTYDKWGNEILPNGLRVKGELFHDESIQKVIAPVLNQFTDRIKYPRTYHLPWSPGMNKDDRQMPDASIFISKDVVITEKMDGENTTWYTDYVHARSINSGSHPSRNKMKDLWAQVGYNIPQDWRVCGENLYAKHSIHYKELESYFYMFSIWDDKNMCLSWDETEEWSELLEIPLVPVLFQGEYRQDYVDSLNQLMESTAGKKEGYVIRLKEEFHYSQFRNSVGKYVRADHVQKNHGHWSQRKITPNELRKR